ncbi:MAG: NifB/NifX family molybdenum-iron cluster-binding protein [bacterium]
MLICVPTKGNAGFEDIVYDHFGSAPCFTLVNTESNDVRVLSNTNATHAHGTCHPMAQLTQYNIDCVVCGGMGRRAIEMLNMNGIKVYASDKKTVREVVDLIVRGELKELDPAMACAGHGSQHGAMCGHGQGEGMIQQTRTGRGQGAGRQGGGGGKGSGRGGQNKA